MAQPCTGIAFVTVSRFGRDVPASAVSRFGAGRPAVRPGGPVNGRWVRPSRKRTVQIRSPFRNGASNAFGYEARRDMITMATMLST